MGLLDKRRLLDECVHLDPWIEAFPVWGSEVVLRPKDNFVRSSSQEFFCLRRTLRRQQILAPSVRVGYPESPSRSTQLASGGIKYPWPRGWNMSMPSSFLSPGLKRCILTCTPWAGFPVDESRTESRCEQRLQVCREVGTVAGYWGSWHSGWLSRGGKPITEKQNGKYGAPEYRIAESRSAAARVATFRD